MAKEKMMPYMSGYSNGYKPPSGSAGGAAFGDFSYKSNPRPVPKKGSELSTASQFGTNGDRQKAMKLKDEQARKEQLRGQGC